MRISDWSSYVFSSDLVRASSTERQPVPAPCDGRARAGRVQGCCHWRARPLPASVSEWRGGGLPRDVPRSSFRSIHQILFNAADARLRSLRRAFEAANFRLDAGDVGLGGKALHLRLDGGQAIFDAVDPIDHVPPVIGEIGRAHV